MPKVVAGEGRVELLVAEMADGRSADAADGAEPEAGASRGGTSKEMLRAAGRAAVEEALLLPLSGVKRKAHELTARELTSEWLAYADVYGQNGLASGGARSSRPAGPEAVDPTCPVGGDEEGEAESRTLSRDIAAWAP